MKIAIFTGSSPAEKIGGAEYQSYLLAKGLANLGHGVVFAALNSRENNEYAENGIQIRNIPGQRVIGTKKHRRLIESAVEEISPDLCYVRVFREIPVLSETCSRLDIPLVSTSSHLMETTPFFLGYYPIEAIGYLRSFEFFRHFRSFAAIQSSVLHVCNTEHLKNEIARWFPRKALRRIYNGSPEPSLSKKPVSKGQIIWVNNLKRWKRPETFIQLARHLPDYRFVMVGRMSASRLHARELRERIRKAPSNFRYIGAHPIAKVNEMIAASDLLLYTSLPVEGFANSFLQAWFRGVPTVSLSFNLDGILEREGIGRCSGSFEELVEDVAELMLDESGRLEMGQRARNYAISNHKVEKMVLEYESLFQEVGQVR